MLNSTTVGSTGTVGHSEELNEHGVDAGWKAVESFKKDTKGKRMEARMSTVVTKKVSRVNGKPNGKHVKFEESRNSLILF